MPTIKGLVLTMSLDSNGVITSRIDYTLEFSQEEVAARIAVVERAVLARRSDGLDIYTTQASTLSGMELLVRQAAGDAADQVIAVLRNEAASYASFGVAAGQSASVSRSFTHTLTDAERSALLEVGREHPYALVSVLPAGIRADVQIAQVEIDVGDPAGVPQADADFPVGTAPVAVVFDGTSVWVANSGSDDVTRLGLDGTFQSSYKVGKTPTVIVADKDAGTIWVANSGDSTVSGHFPNGGLVGAAIAAPGAVLAIGGGNLWIATEGTLLRVDSTTAAILGTFPLPGRAAAAIAYGGGGLWIADEVNGIVICVSDVDGSLVGTYRVGTRPLGIAADSGNVWVTNSGDSTVTKLRSNGAVLGTFSVGTEPVGIVIAHGMAWVANAGGSIVTRLTHDGSTDMTINVGSNSGGIAYDGQNIWVTREGANSVARRVA